MMFFVYKRVLGPLNHCFDRLDQKKIRNAAYLPYLRIFISTESHTESRQYYLKLAGAPTGQAYAIFFPQPIVEDLLNCQRRVSDRPSWI